MLLSGSTALFLASEGVIPQSLALRSPAHVFLPRPKDALLTWTSPGRPCPHAHGPDGEPGVPAEPGAGSACWLAGGVWSRQGLAGPPGWWTVHLPALLVPVAGPQVVPEPRQERRRVPDGQAHVRASWWLSLSHGHSQHLESLSVTGEEEEQLQVDFRGKHTGWSHSPPHPPRYGCP